MSVGARGAGAMPSAVVFDCDGTLVDTERVTVAGMRAALGRQGHELTDEDVATVVGHPWPRTRQRLVEWFGLTPADIERYRADMQELVHPLLDDDDLVFGDVVEVTTALRERGIPMAVCTSSGRGHLDRILRLSPLRGVFDARVAREDVERHKPDPLPYREAIARLGEAHGRSFDPHTVAVVEDSHAGVAAGVAAGCWTIAVDRGAGLHDLSAADVVVRRLELTAFARR